MHVCVYVCVCALVRVRAPMCVYTMPVSLQTVSEVSRQLV